MPRGGVMIWGLITSDGDFEVSRVNEIVNSEVYTLLIVKDVLPVIDEIS